MAKGCEGFFFFFSFFLFVSEGFLNDQGWFQSGQKILWPLRDEVGEVVVKVWTQEADRHFKSFSFG